MWIVRLALRRPYTFIVASILILILGVVSIVRTPVDIFPNIDIPVITVVWQYTGLSPEEMSNRIVFNFERSLTTTVNNIQHIESQSLAGVGLVKVFFQPHTDIAFAIAQVTAISQSTVRNLPPGITPPFIVEYSASRPERTAIGRHGPEFHPHRPDYDSRHRDPISIWWEAAHGDG
jgi:multidrug efflux pump subunit AcrB